MPRIQGTSPGRVPLKDMNDREWRKFLSDMRAVAISEGQDDYDTGVGFWLGIDAGTPKFSIGDSAANKMTWDGTTLSITGDVSGTQLVIKSANTDRASTTTLTADPHLSKGLLASATYLVEIGLAYIADSTGTGAQGFNCSFPYSGSASLIGPLLGYKTANGVITGLFGDNASPMPSGVAPILQESGGLSDHLTARFYLATTTAGNLTVDWAQAVSSANFTRLRGGSYIRVTRTIT